MKTLTPGSVSALVLAATAMMAAPVLAQPFAGTIQEPVIDRWNYPFNSSPGTEPTAPIFAALAEPGFDDRDSTFVLVFNTQAVAPTGCGDERYIPTSVSVRVWVSGGDRFAYDPTPDSVATSYPTTDAAYVADADLGKPVEIFAAGFRNGVTARTYTESTAFSTLPPFPPAESIRSVFPARYARSGSALVATDVSNHVAARFEAPALAVGLNPTLTPGELVPTGAYLDFAIDLSDSVTRSYFSRAFNSGRLVLVVSSLHPASGGPGGGTGSVNYPAFYTKENALAPLLGFAASLSVTGSAHPFADFDLDGDTGTDADIEAFFRSIAGSGEGNPDFDMDGDVGTDADIEAFFRALAGG